MKCCVRVHFDFDEISSSLSLTLLRLKQRESLLAIVDGRRNRGRAPILLRLKRKRELGLSQLFDVMGVALALALPQLFDAPQAALRKPKTVVLLGAHDVAGTLHVFGILLRLRCSLSTRLNVCSYLTASGNRYLNSTNLYRDSRTIRTPDFFTSTPTNYGSKAQSQ